MAQAFELERSHFSQVFEQAAIGMALVGLDGSWLKVNATLSHILGYTEQELLGMTFSMITHPDDSDAHVESTRQLLEGHKGFQLEKRYLHRQGHIVWVYLTITLVRDSEGKPLFFIVQTQDISDRKHTEQLLIQSEQQYKSLFLYNPNAISSSDPAGKFFDVNPAMENIFGYKAHEFMRMTFDSLVHPDDTSFARMHYDRACTGEPQHYEVKALHKNGNLIYVHITNSPIIVQNKIVGMYWIARDVTELKQKTNQLRENQELLELLTENVIDVISYINPDGICGYISPSVTTLLGYDPEDLIGKNFIQHFHPDDLKEMRSQKFEMETLTFRIRHKSGHYVWLETTVRAVCDPNGHPVTYIGIGRDITARKLMEEKLRKSEESLKAAQKIARFGSWEWDIVQDERVWSDEMFSIFEVDPDEFVTIRNYMKRFTHPEDIKKWEQAFQDVFTNKTNRQNIRIITQSGKVKHLHIQAIVIDNEEGEPVRMHGTVQDISERVENHRLLEEALQRFTSLKEYNPDPVISLDQEGLYLSGNKAMERLTGYRNEELVGMHFSSIVSEEFHTIAQDLLQQVLSGAIPEDAQMTIRTKQGQPISVVTTPAPIVIDGHIVGCYIIAKDITEQKRKDELLLNTEKQTITGQLSAAIAHEIRNPMTAINGFLKLMKSNGYKEEYVNILQEECSRIEIITNELLVLAKPQALKLNVRNVVGTVDQVIALLESQANMNSVSLIKAYEEQDVPVNCDENQVKQVFINIIKNAIEVMPKGGEAKIAVKRAAGSVVVSITDQGHGIPADKMTMLGQPFYSTKEKGTGLGLMVSYKIIESHKGRIHVSSEVGKGTTFEIVLPIYEGAETKVPAG